MIQDDFHRWMIHIDGRKVSVADAYVYAIKQLSEHYSIQKHKRIDFYNITDVDEMSKIADMYRTGIYRTKGYQHHGTNAAAIRKYVQFLSYRQRGRTGTPPQEPPPTSDPPFENLNAELGAARERIAELGRECDRLRETVHRLIRERDAARLEAERLKREMQQPNGNSKVPRSLRLAIARVHPDNHATASEFERSLRSRIFAELWSEIEARAS